MLSNTEIDKQELILGLKYDATQHSECTQKVLLKILDTIETDGDLLSDGEVIDMIHCLLNGINLQQLKAERDSQNTL